MAEVDTILVNLDQRILHPNAIFLQQRNHELVYLFSLYLSMEFRQFKEEVLFDCLMGEVNDTLGWCWWL